MEDLELGRKGVVGLEEGRGRDADLGAPASMDAKLDPGGGGGVQHEEQTKTVD